MSKGTGNKGTGRRRGQAKEETRRLILEAAYHLFEAKGFRETTMRQIASQAGVGLGTIFNHFPDKAFLLVEAFETDVNAVIAQALATLPGQDIQKQLLHLSGTLYDCYFKRPRLSLQIIGGVYQSEGPAADKLKQQMTDFLEVLAGLFEAAKTRGELAGTVDCLDAAFAFWSFYVMCLGMGLWQEQPDLDEQLRLLDRLLRQHVSAMLEERR